LMAQADGIFASHVGAVKEVSPWGGGEVAWAIIALVLAVGSILVTARVVGGWKTVPAKDSAAPTGLRRLLYNKWYVDELYDTIIVQPVLRASRLLWRFIDDGLIDRTVNGVGQLARGIGWVGSRFQTGQLNTYAFMLVVGVLLILLRFVTAR
jgi:NADH-quinone oxidoreductase subunit L